MLKRLFDITVASLALLVLSPLLLLISVLVRLDSSGPSCYRQERVGRYGARFRIHKFRTMHVGTKGALISTAHDPRITRIGAVLRRSKLDELPQLIDVVAGYMSLVGPRPEVPQYVELWQADDRRKILSVRPGITDPASLHFRNEAEALSAAAEPEIYYVSVVLPMKTQMYLDYVDRHSFFGDIRIIVQTLYQVALG